MEEVQLEEEKRFNKIFQRACYNFHSEKHNLYLLFYGYIHHEIDDTEDLYQNIPLDIIQTCIVFGYDVNIMMTDDSFNVELKTEDEIDAEIVTALKEEYSKYAEWSNDNKTLKWTLSELSTMDKFKNFFSNIANNAMDASFGYRVFGTYNVEYWERRRKVWNIKILDYAKDKEIDIAIGICEYNDTIVPPEFLYCTLPNDEKISSVKVGDTLSVLCLFNDPKEYGEKWPWGPRVCFGVNGEKKKEIQIEPHHTPNQHAMEYRLIIIIHDSITIQLVD